MLRDGQHLFRVRIGGATEERRFSIDTLVPKLEFGKVEYGKSPDDPVIVTVHSNKRLEVTDSNLVPGGTILPAGDTRLGPVTVEEGYHPFTVFYRDDAGNTAMASESLKVPEMLKFDIESPAPGTTVDDPDPEAIIYINQEVTVLESTPGFLSRGKFGFYGGGNVSVPFHLREGLNTLSAKVSTSFGVTTTLSVSLTLRRAAPPVVVIEDPRPNSVIRGRFVTVTGHASKTTFVSIKGAMDVKAPVVENRFSAEVPLAPGMNRIRVRAIRWGELPQQSAPETSVMVFASAGLIVRSIGGALQVLSIGQDQPMPLVVRVTDRAGAPARNVDLRFSVVSSPTQELVGKWWTVTSDREGVASFAPPSPTRESERPNGPLEVTVIEADTAMRVGAAPRFRLQGILANRVGKAGAAAHIVAVGSDCDRTPDAAGDCPVGEAAQVMEDPFGVIILDSGFHVVPDWPVKFVVDAGAFDGSREVTVRSDSRGFAHPKTFRPGTSVDPQAFLWIHPADEFGTPSRMNHVTASLGAGTPAVVPLAAYSIAGPVVTLGDLSPRSPRPGIVELAAEDALRVKAVDFFGNAVANVPIVFNAVEDLGDPGRGPRLYRSDPTSSTALPCRYRLAHRSDDCATESITVTTGPDGTAWAQMLLGQRDRHAYFVEARSSESVLRLQRDTGRVQVHSPRRPIRLVQYAGSPRPDYCIPAPWFHSGEPGTTMFTATTWDVTCETVGDKCDGFFHARRRAGDTITFDIEGHRFVPQDAVSGQPAFFGIAAPEVGAVTNCSAAAGTTQPNFKVRFTGSSEGK